ncbi:hypothetical protein B566_EDAN008983, partial [Ephemera danica]
MISLESLAISALLVILYYVNSSRIFDFRQWLFALYMTSIGGQNLCDYPEGSQLILVDINDKFEPIIRTNCAKFRGLHLEKFYVTDAADMHEIPDGSVDAVVSQFALCSCDKVSSVLAEVKRIL